MTAGSDLKSLIEEFPLFQRLRSDSLKRILQHGMERTFGDGETIISYGKPGELFGVVLEGKAEVLPGGGAGPAVATFSRGSFFGEMSLLTGEPTTAEVRAQGQCRCLLIPHETLSRELPLNPELLTSLARTLTERLRQRASNEAEQEAVESARRSERGTRSFRPVSAVAVSRILVLNLGSSSLKYDFLDSTRPEQVFKGLVERIGEGEAVHRMERGKEGGKASVAAPNHEAALRLVLDGLTSPEGGVLSGLDGITAVGHRVVHGGDRYSASVLIDDDVLEEIRRTSALAPLHNPINLRGIELCRQLLPGVPQVAVFDTAFHQSMPKHAYLYALPYELYEKHQIRRYGFHGTSHKYVAMKAAAHMRRSFQSVRLITCHLGNGTSVAAVDHGRVIDTSMGLTPLEGLVMGTRSGDLDPGIVLHLCNQLGMSPSEVDRILNRESGLKGLSGISNDMREIVGAAEEGNPRAILAVQVFCYRLKKYIGAYVAALGGLDALVFTGGIGEHSSWIRARACQGLGHMGIALDEDLNQGANPKVGSAANIAAEGASAQVLVVPTDEEGMIARETEAVLKQSRVTETVEPQSIPIPIGISAHHVHLSSDHVEALFGQGHRLTFRKELTQPGQFACEEVVDLIGPRGRVDKVRILGPERKQSQIEISRTEEFKLGIDAPIRASGDLDGSPGLTLVGPKGKVQLAEGAICALRHIHAHPEDALRLGIRDKDIVRVRWEGERSLIFGDVLVRVHPEFRLEMHVDTDEANAAEMNANAVGFIDSIQSRRL
jgi:acetate kinase